MFISFATIWMISGYFYSPEISLEKVKKEELVVRVMDQNSVLYNEKILIKGSRSMRMEEILNLWK